MEKRKKTSDAVDILKHRLTGGDTKKLAQLEKELAIERENSNIAQQIYDLRKGAGLTQAELAAKIGTRRESIARLEDADYGGHSLTMLTKIAIAVNRSVKVTFPKRTRRTGTMQLVADRSTQRAVSKKKPKAVAKKRSRTTA